MPLAPDLGVEERVGHEQRNLVTHLRRALGVAVDQDVRHRIHLCTRARVSASSRTQCWPTSCAPKFSWGSASISRKPAASYSRRADVRTSLVQRPAAGNRQREPTHAVTSAPPIRDFASGARPAAGAAGRRPIALDAEDTAADRRRPRRSRRAPCPACAARRTRRRSSRRALRTTRPSRAPRHKGDRGARPPTRDPRPAARACTRRGGAPPRRSRVPLTRADESVAIGRGQAREELAIPLGRAPSSIANVSCP